MPSETAVGKLFLCRRAGAMRGESARLIGCPRDRFPFSRLPQLRLPVRLELDTQPLSKFPMEDRVILHAYRHLYKRALLAIRHAPPSRHVLRHTLRSSFRSGDRSDFDPEKIARTLEFLDLAAESTSYEHKIIKNLLHVRYFQQPNMRTASTM
jgi:hypothetical protein